MEGPEAPQAPFSPEVMFIHVPHTGIKFVLEYMVTRVLRIKR